MVFNCEFGNFLNELYKWFEQIKIQGLITMSWQVWLNTHINISASHASSLRQLSSVVNGFPKLKTIDARLHLQALRRQALSHQVRQKQTVYVSPHEHWAVPGEPGCQNPWVYRGLLPPVGYNRGNKAEEYRQSS